MPYGSSLPQSSYNLTDYLENDQNPHPLTMYILDSHDKMHRLACQISTLEIFPTCTPLLYNFEIIKGTLYMRMEIWFCFIFMALQFTLRWPFLISSPELKAQVSFSDHIFVCKLHIFIFFSRTTGPISTKVDTKHPWVMGIQVCSNEGLHPFPWGENYEIVKIHWTIWKIFSRTTGPTSTKFGKKHPGVKRI